MAMPVMREHHCCEMHLNWGWELGVHDFPSSAYPLVLETPSAGKINMREPYAHVSLLVSVCNGFHEKLAKVKDTNAPTVLI